MNRQRRKHSPELKAQMMALEAVRGVKTISPFRPLFAVLCFLLFSFLFDTAHAATTYSYDARHRLIGATYTDGCAIAYTYDTTSNRLQKTMTAAPTQSASEMQERGTVASLFPQNRQSPDQTKRGNAAPLAAPVQ